VSRCLSLARFHSTRLDVLRSAVAALRDVHPRGSTATLSRRGCPPPPLPAATADEGCGRGQRYLAVLRGPSAAVGMQDPRLDLVPWSRAHTPLSGKRSAADRVQPDLRLETARRSGEPCTPCPYRPHTLQTLQHGIPASGRQ